MTLFRIESIQFHVLPMHTRFPFRYGIASMCGLPHVFVTVELEIGGKLVRGLATEGLAPKWFTKNPDTLLEQDVAEMLAVIQNAGRIGRHAAARPIGFFDWWRALYEEQSQWAAHLSHPPLLAHFGTSLIERSVLDALCRAAGLPLHQLLRTDQLGIDLGAVRESLRGIPVHAALADEPVPQIQVRHTIGLGDPLTAADVPPGEEMNDGLPHTLEDCIRAYGLRWFKIKVSGHVSADLQRLTTLADLLHRHCPDGYHCTLDGNEQFHTIAAFRAFLDELQSTPAIAPLFQRILLIEQPVHRTHALDDSLEAEFKAWNGPPLIIDESDGSLTDLPKALALGYSGTSHKNCKGIVKSLANAALLRLTSATTGRPTHLTGEDLASVGPFAMLKDLAMAAAYGITHVERNGHHYFRGLSMYPASLQNEVLQTHGDLYRRHPEGFPTLDIRDGTLHIASVNAAPFGHFPLPDLADYEPLNTWIKRGGMGEL